MLFRRAGRTSYLRYVQHRNLSNGVKYWFEKVFFMPSALDITASPRWPHINGYTLPFERYRDNGAHPAIVALAKLENRKFGAEVEKILKSYFGLLPPVSTQHDALCSPSNKPTAKIEIKSARYWANGNDCKWQHLEPNHDYDHVLFVLVDYQDIKVWHAKKSVLFKHGLVTPQGKQGYWGIMTQLVASGYLNRVRTKADLHAAL